MPFEWLTPIEKGLPQLQEALSMVKPQDLQIGNPALEPIRTSWLGIWFVVKPLPQEEDEQDVQQSIKEIRKLLSDVTFREN